MGGGVHLRSGRSSSLAGDWLAQVFCLWRNQLRRLRMPVRKTTPGVGGLTGYVTQGHMNQKGTDDEAVFFESSLERDC